MASSYVEELLRQLAEERERADRERERANREREHADRAERKLAEEREHAEQKLAEEREHAEQMLAEERERANRAEAKQAPTTLEQYLRLIQQRLVTTLLVESNPVNSASGSVTAVNEKFYPLELCRWDDFEKQLERTFIEISSVFSSRSLFPSETDILGVQRELSPTSRKDEQDIRPFVRSAIEKPAERIVRAYYDLTNRPEKFCFQNNAYSLEYRDPETEIERRSPSKRRSPERKKSQPIPDRWGICEEEGGLRRVCVGEYKAAHKVPDEEIRQVLDTASKNLFLEVLWRKQSGTTNSEQDKAKELVAQILCQAFHYMIQSGLLFGYITSGRTLILLRVDEFAQQRQARESEAQYAPATQLATFALLALRAREMPRDWIVQAENCGIYQWPLVPNPALHQNISLQPQTYGGETSESSGENDDPNDSDYGASQRQSRSQPDQQSRSQNERRRSPRKRTERSVGEYCTQACLLGLVQKSPLDVSCPNFSMHKRSSARGKHPITKDDLCCLLRKQLDRSLDQSCECLDRKGFFGDVGVLFKVTLTEYGYTFVAKGVQKANERDLAHEMKVYSHLVPLQGKNIPVCLGSIALTRPYPLVSMAKVTKMLLMSWAGTSLCYNTWPEGVDIKKETDKTLQTLAQSGVRHDDIRQSNLVWNAERQRVMAIDLQQATITSVTKRQASPPVLHTRKHRKIARSSSHIKGIVI
ncbi:conserved hypothetical protein [Talaromyces stipitatus ATCC 10500]|uniref:Protein kinase domain-containing protein n=1 Tax=Talaromyces stipitatus (strain ATCC 10500 / CBS 375.48 / QM 6759 / NRRL 1006) TaxID=441959 RepID=B8M025_TALSN|nr:uncharacterized protein TSTA_081900 [Talaromyces stipitatus ATCC 10500]EED20957.1 conserved hypothetical protein [Talaromyces stipitatus ATCC 10500]